MNRLLRRRVWAVACSMIVSLPVAAAADTSKDLLDAVPQGAWAALYVRSLGELDGKLTTLQQQLNVPAMSMLSTAKGALGLMSGINDKGGAAIVLMPADNIADPQVLLQSMALLVPCSDFAALTSTMTPQDMGDGVSQVSVMGQPSFIAQRGGFAVLAPSAQSVKSVTSAAAGAGMSSNWTRHQHERFAEDDITLAINMEAFTASPAFQAMTPMLAMMSGGSFNPAELMELRSYALALRLNKAGLRTGFYSGVKEGSPSAKIVSSLPTTSQSLLKGLPKDKYLLTFGAQGSKETWAKAAAGLTGMLRNPMVAMQLQANPDKLNRLVEIMAGMLRDTRDVAVSVAGFQPGPDGILGAVKVVTVESGAAGKCAQFAEIVQLISSGLVPNPEVSKAMEIVKYAAGAETIAGVKVDHLAVHLDQLEQIPQEEITKWKKVVGREGVLVRFAAVDDRHIAVTFGGGPGRMEQVIGLVKSGGAPLGADEGIKRVAQMLPAKRSAELYLSIPNLFRTAIDVGKSWDDPADLPFAPPDADVPVGIVYGPVDHGSTQMDVAVPMELMVAIKDASLAAQSAGAGGQPADTTPE